MFKKTVFLFGLVLLISCSPSSPLLSVDSPTTPKKEFNPPEQKVSNAVALDFNAKVDILFVVDDSGSMMSHQKRLAKNIDLLTASIEKNKIIDYHIGVITCSMEGGVSPGGKLRSTFSTPTFIQRSTADGISLLKQNLLVGTGGSATEMFFLPVMTALSPQMLNSVNSGFYRSDASLVVIFITDAEDQSTSLKTAGDMSANEYYDFLLSLKNGDASKVVQYGIIIPSSFAESTDCPRDTPNTPPLKIEQAISMLKGIENNLCDSNYTSKLDVLGQDILEKISRVVYLNRRPDPKSIVVKYGDVIIPNDIDNGWTFDPSRNAIEFGLKLMKTLSGTSNKMDIQYTTIDDKL